MTPTQFQQRLLHWFDQHGRKHLPWQENKTPYRVWVSEIMLQQTQVATVITYFKRFMQHFPSILALATAPEDEVLHLWAGLGYYSRARNLHRAAKMVIENYAGKLPSTLSELLKLPGIGPSTAGAILSIAFNQPVAILDGNVKRVLARFHAIKEPINEKETEKKLWGLANQYTPAKRNPDYTQAIMDLGATLCTQKNPRCEHCPLQAECAAFLQKITGKLPVKKAKNKIPTRQATLLIFKKGKKILLCKRPANGIWGGLWSFPEIAGEPKKQTISTYCQRYFNLETNTYLALDAFRHTFTHYHLDIFPIVIEVKKLIDIKATQIWYNLTKPQAVGLPKPIQTIMKALSR